MASRRSPVSASSRSIFDQPDFERKEPQEEHRSMSRTSGGATTGCFLRKSRAQRPWYGGPSAPHSTQNILGCFQTAPRYLRTGVPNIGLNPVGGGIKYRSPRRPPPTPTPSPTPR